ncbi:SusC/RagA family TonB-linked outer membrane protein [Wenyingzhuangia sp. 2_MG-2023]|uniref:SusC/RagA family TonB-linked outer membrane protein n=1 Tax=Wenyingzhuangia sp. 2_MG-2023 TaxID=3062639 RepID=UPI0026E1B8A0|nr:SusC/RagA family TonB-linked outer membrane protein [Wenyingzhuangia sp. 2_MG-2023]MDO6739017.1 SusC/RagA family TonB-linked outer membrane protein [Wenyingzhuangia sp. 2_MG-2023]MDO6803451.1 SusC/RagA family TonB-linked outer membrane protein [Wenyingzhuangia sp. 1_MG-2023]
MKVKLTNVFFLFRERYLQIIMKTFIFLCFTTVFGFIPSNLVSQNSKIKIEEDSKLTVDQVFDLVMEQTDYKFIYQEGVFNHYPIIEVKKGSIRLNKLLQKCLQSGDLNIILTKNNTILIKDQKTSKQQRSVTGRITDTDGIAIAGVTVLIKGTIKGTTSDLEGKYSITVQNLENVLVFSYLGADTQEITVGNQTVINVTLKEDISQLEEVVINGGYYKTERSTSTGNIGKVSSKDIEKQPVTNPLGTIQGRMAGVEIRQLSSTPGSGFQIFIRGFNSLNGGDPLYIVDGTPLNLNTGANLDNGLTSQVILPGGINPLQGINPNNIESIEVLKDADATAIYGSRGANGVVLITTKKGKAGKTVFDVNVFTGFNALTRKRSYLNTEQHLEIRRESFANDQAFDTANGFPLTEIGPRDFDLNGTYSEDKYTDWQDFFLGNTGQINNAQLAISGGSKRTQFNIGGGFSTESPTIPGENNTFEKISIQSSINHRSEDDKFSIALNASYVSTEANYPVSNFINGVGLVPNRPDLIDENGDLTFIDAVDSNPLSPTVDDFNATTTNLIASSIIAYEFLPNLKMSVNLGYNLNTSGESRTDRASFNNPLNPVSANPANSSLLINTGKTSSYNFEPQLNWNGKVGPGRMSVLVGATYNDRNTVANFTKASNFADDAFIYNIGSAADVLIDKAEIPYAYAAYFGRIGYNIKDKYIINFSGRRDGSSRFGEDKRFSTFGSVGAAWVFSEENFLKNNAALSFGKLRASYGRTGSDNIGDFGYLDLYRNTTGFYSGVQGNVPAGLANPNYSWEGVNKFEVGLSLGFLNNRINFDASYYQNRTTNQLLLRPLPATSGFTGVLENLPAVIQNKGLELELTTINIQNESFRWTTNFNITIPKNELLEFPDLENNNAFRNRLVVGESINSFRAFEFNGVDPQTGLYTFTDFSGNGIIDRFGIDDAQVLLKNDSKFFGGLSNNINYKNFDASFTFNFTKRDGALIHAGSQPGLTAFTTDILDRWQQPGDITDTQRLTTVRSNDIEATDAATIFRGSDGAWGDRSFIRLQNLSIGYTVPKEVTNAFTTRVYLQAQNLLTLTKYEGWDPERAIPLYRTITFGAQFTF